MLEKHNLKQLVEKDFTALADNVMRAISLDNLFCFKSPSYKAAIDTYHLAMETELKPTQTRMSSNHRQSYKNKLNENIKPFAYALSMYVLAMVKFGWASKIRSDNEFESIPSLNSTCK